MKTSASLDQKPQLAVSIFLPVLPVVLLINGKVGDVHVIPLPGTLVIGQVLPFDQVVIDPLLIHTGTETEKKGAFSIFLSMKPAGVAWIP